MSIACLSYSQIHLLRQQFCPGELNVIIYSAKQHAKSALFDQAEYLDLVHVSVCWCIVLILFSLLLTVLCIYQR